MLFYLQYSFFFLNNPRFLNIFSEFMFKKIMMYGLLALILNRIFSYYKMEWYSFYHNSNLNVTLDWSLNVTPRSQVYIFTNVPSICTSIVWSLYQSCCGIPVKKMIRLYHLNVQQSPGALNCTIPCHIQDLIIRVISHNSSSEFSTTLVC